MSKTSSFLENKVMPVAGRIAAQRHLQALRDGLILTMPLIIVGSVFLILGFLPIPGYEDFMANTFGDQWLTKLLYPVSATFDIMALIAGFGIAYRLAEKYNVDALTAGAISISAFLLATPYQISFLASGASSEEIVGGVIPVALMGSRGLFVAMLIAMLSTEIYRFVVQKNIVIKMPAGVPPAVSRSFVALIPGFFVITLVWIIRLIIEQTDFGSIHTLISDIIATPLGVLGSSLIGSLVAVFAVHLLWSCGLHGAAIVGGVMGPIWLTNMDANRAVFQSGGTDLPHIFTQQFFDIFIFVGGSGATLGLVVAMLFWARSQQMKQLGRLAIGPGMFNINEPITFGMPIVMNPLMIVPFILAPLVTVIISYVAISTGLVHRPAGISVPWTMPPLIGGYLAAGNHISGAILQAVNFVVVFLIYFPFFKLWDKQKLTEEQNAEATLTNDSSLKA